MYYQQLDLETCPTSHPSGRDFYRRSLQYYDGVEEFFLEYRLQTDGDRSEIPGGAPTVVALRNDAGIGYNITVAEDLVKFFRDVDLPILFVEIVPGIAHIYRIELYLDRYAFYIDGYLIDEGKIDGPFPVLDPRITWGGAAWYLPCENAWDYIRYGVTPVDGSGDFDSDKLVALNDFYFTQECLTNQRPGINGGPDMDSGPGCRFADFDADGDVDLHDFADLQNVFMKAE